MGLLVIIAVLFGCATTTRWLWLKAHDECLQNYMRVYAQKPTGRAVIRPVISELITENYFSSIGTIVIEHNNFIWTHQIGETIVFTRFV